MQEQNFTKNDWKLFRDKIASWQEKYMATLCNNYIELLNKDIASSEKFWTLEKMIKADKRAPGVILEIRKSQFIFNIIALINDNVISFKDIEDFSDELQTTVKHIIEQQYNISTYIQGDTHDPRK